jgi:hypothetical protein
MNSINFLISTLSLLIAGTLTVTFAFMLVRSDLYKYLRYKDSDQQVEVTKHLLPLRLQAHERITVYIDRINPSNLFIRLNEPGITVREFQFIILNDIRLEYQHNVAQQLYVSAATWAVVKKLKEDTVVMINNAASGLQDGLPAVDLSRKVLQHMAGMEDNPYELTLDLIKKDIHQLF